MDRLRARWSDAANDTIRGDLVAAASYLTASGGAVVTGVVPLGIDDRDNGTLGFTTSLGMGKKLEHLARDPRVALAFHTRHHGFSDSPLYVLAQGIADIDLRPSAKRLEAFIPQAERFLGPVRRGPLWDPLLHEYYWERVFVDVRVVRVVTWPDLAAHGQPEVAGARLPGFPPPQQAPARGTEPRVEVGRVARQIAALPHRVLAYRGDDGFPVVVPVEVSGHDAAGLRVTAADGLLPPGGRRAGLLAHAFEAQVAGLATRTMTGWLDVADDGSTVYAPHTSKGFAAPANKTLVLIVNGLYAKWGYRRALRSGVLERLDQLAAERGSLDLATSPGAIAPRPGSMARLDLRGHGARRHG